MTEEMRNFIELNYTMNSIEDLEFILNAPGAEADPDFDSNVEDACNFMQHFHELVGFSWGEYKEMVQ